MCFVLCVFCVQCAVCNACRLCLHYVLYTVNNLPGQPGHVGILDLVLPPPGHDVLLILAMFLSGLASLIQLDPVSRTDRVLRTIIYRHSSLPSTPLSPVLACFILNDDIFQTLQLLIICYETKGSVGGKKVELNSINCATAGFLRF